MYVSFGGMHLQNFSHSSDPSIFLTGFYSPLSSFLLRLEPHVVCIQTLSYIPGPRVFCIVCLCILYMRLTARNVGMYRNLENVSEL